MLVFISVLIIAAVAAYFIAKGNKKQADQPAEPKVEVIEVPEVKEEPVVEVKKVELKKKAAPKKKDAPITSVKKKVVKKDK